MLLRVGDVRSGAADMQFSCIDRIRADESCKAPSAYDATSPTICRTPYGINNHNTIHECLSPIQLIPSIVWYSMRERPDIVSEDPADWCCLEVDVPHPAKPYLAGCETMTAYLASFWHLMTERRLS